MLTDKQIAEEFLALPPEQRAMVMKVVSRSMEADELQTANSRYLSENGIIEFVRTRLGATPKPYQERILRAIVKHKRVAVRSPHGAGKTTVAAWFVLWLMEVYDDVKVPTLSPTDRQNGFLWSEIRKWAKRLDNKSFRTLQRRLEGISKEAFSVSSDNAALIEGIHARTVGFVVDEARAVSDPFFDSIEGAFSNVDNDADFTGYWLTISTPGNPSGMFYAIHSKKAGLTDWHTIHVTIEECIKAGAISRKWVNDRKTQWGETSAVFRNRVLAEFDESGEDACIPLSWVEKAIERGYLLAKEQGDIAISAVGVDPARYGLDKTAIARLKGRLILPLTYFSQSDTMETSGRVTSTTDKKTKIGVDVIGIGAGVTDRLKELKYRVTGVNVAEAAKDSRGKPLKDATDTFEFANLRSFIWWLLRDSLNPDNPDAIGLPDDDILIGDLTSPQYRYLSNGRIQVEAKDDTRKRLKRSTDGADAVGLALYVDTLNDAPVKAYTVRYA